MEKFRLFTDKATGINPFTPVRGLDTISWPRFIVGFVIFIFTIPILLIIESTICLYESLYSIFSVMGLSVVVKMILGPIQYLMTRLYLILLHHSFWAGAVSAFPKNPRVKLVKEYFSAQKITKLSESDETAKDEWKVSNGDVVICNCQSPMDIVVLQRLFWSTPLIFAFPASDDNNNTDDDQKNSTKTPGVWWTAFRHAAMLRSLSSSCIAKKRVEDFDVRALQRLGRKIGRPVILFAEGAPSNGKSVLRLPESVTVEGDLVKTMKFVGITYLNSNAVNATIPQNPVSFFIRLLGESIFSGGNGIDCVISRPSVMAKMLSEEDADSLVHISLPKTEVSKISNEMIVEVNGDRLQELLAETVSFERLSTQPCRTVTLSTKEKYEFYEMWQKRGKLV